MEYLCENYVSVVTVVSNDAGWLEEKISRLKQVLETHFKYYEFVFVDNHSEDDSLKRLKELDLKCTIVALSHRHKLSQAVMAGIDCAIGDYIFEIEDLKADVEYEQLIQMYDRCQQGYDFVFLTPKNSRSASRLFYRVLNQKLHFAEGEGVVSSVCILSSRRGQNKVSAMGDYIVNRNVAYVMAGLNCAYIEADMTYRNRRGILANINLMLDTFIYYTDAVVHLLMMAALFFLVISVGMGVYSLFSYAFEDIAAGWTSTIMFVSFGFSGIFGILVVVAKCLDHILRNTSHSKQYIFRDFIKK